MDNIKSVDVLEQRVNELRLCVDRRNRSIENLRAQLAEARGKAIEDCEQALYGACAQMEIDDRFAALKET